MSVLHDPAIAAPGDVDPLLGGLTLSRLALAHDPR
jgi:hypothetical protein